MDAVLEKSLDELSATIDERMAEIRRLRTERDVLLAACKRSVGELLYAAEKLPHSNAREALVMVRTAIASCGA